MQIHSRYPTAVSVATAISLIGMFTSLPAVGQELTMTVTTVREDVWRLDPQLLGLPNTSFLHTIYDSTEGGADSVQIHAPKYYGGMIKIGFADSMTEVEIEALADSLNRF